MIQENDNLSNGKEEDIHKFTEFSFILIAVVAVV